MFSGSMYGNILPVDVHNFQVFYIVTEIKLLIN